MIEHDVMSYAEYIREVGLYFVLGWFMLRFEKILKANTDAINCLKKKLN